MTAFLACALALNGPSNVAPETIIHLTNTGRLETGSEVKLLPGTSTVTTPYGVGFDFNGEHCGIEITDAPTYRLTGSMTVACWINLRSYVTGFNSAPGAQILFRGDDRSGCDPYHLTVLSNGTITFSVENSAGEGANVAAPMPLAQWVHVVGSFDNETGELRLYLNGTSMAQARTAFRSFGELDAGWSPGVGIGNVQRSSNGMHNQPLNGQICDLRLYGKVLPPGQAGYGAAPSRWPGFPCG